MSYLVLARKYRPRSFEQMVGQPHIVKALGNALLQRRLHHAYLFTGTRGVGKTTVSRILAKSLNCVGEDGRGDITATPCGRCQPCRDIDAGRFVDYVELDAASNRGVEEISQLLDQAVYKPVLGRFKVYMVDEVHMLSNHAFNAMLKTLEEPPDYLKFVLATTDPQKVPVTVLSRCLQFNLRPMAAQTVYDYLTEVLGMEGLPFEPGALQLLARSARGSMRDALSLTDQAIAYAGGSVQEAAVREMLGSVDGTQVARVARALAGRQAAALVDAVDELRVLGISAAGVLEELASLAQRIAVTQVVADDGDALRAPLAELAAELAALLAPDETQLIYSVALHGRAELPLAPDEYSGLLMVLLRCHAFLADGAPAAPAAAGPGQAGPSADAAAGAGGQPAVAVSESGGPGEAGAARADLRRPPPAVAAARTVPPEQPLMPQAAPEAALQTAPQAVVPSLMQREAPPASLAAAAPDGAIDSSLGERWSALVGRLIAEGAIGALVRELAWQAECIAVEPLPAGQRWCLRVEQQSLRSPAHQERLQAAMSAALACEVSLQIEAGPAADTPARRDSALRQARQQAAEALIESDPAVQALLQQYASARIVPGSIKPL